MCFRGVFTSRTELARIRAAAERVASSYGFEIFDVQLRREPVGTVLRVVIDRPAGPSSDPQERSGGEGGADAPQTPEVAEDSIGVADCQRVSQDLSALLDVEDDELGEEFAQSYTLEVSSPGLDRPLRHEADYRRFRGRLAKIVTTAPVDGQSAFAGRIAGLDDGFVLLQEGRKVHRVPLAQIKRGRLEVEF